MPYPEELIAPMRQDLVQLGFQELKTADQVDVLVSVFAGQDLEATERAREYFTGYPPSSPAVVLMKNGELVYMLERHEIEGRHPLEIADTLKAAYNEHCSVSPKASELPAV
jgi:hypothetical protein